MDQKVITIMEIFKGMSRQKRSKFIQERHNLIDKSVFPNPKQSDSGNGNFQCGNMNKDYCGAIIKDVVTEIGYIASNTQSKKTEKVQQATTGTEEHSNSEPTKEDIEKAEAKMIQNELISTRAARYLNSHINVTSTVVYNYNVF